MTQQERLCAVMEILKQVSPIRENVGQEIADALQVKGRRQTDVGSAHG